LPPLDAPRERDDRQRRAIPPACLLAPRAGDPHPWDASAREAGCVPWSGQAVLIIHIVELQEPFSEFLESSESSCRADVLPHMNPADVSPVYLERISATRSSVFFSFAPWSFYGHLPEPVEFALGHDHEST
jgi:hypothetical protein